jgi:acyl carrier protein phosphodiesterase
MNYLSHHHVAFVRHSDAPPFFYLGNVLPDLYSAAGEGRLRESDVEKFPQDSLLTQGIKLHLATDKHFHGTLAFEQAMAFVAERFHAETFSAPPKRVFFLAHVFVELVLDAHLARTEPQLLEHHYAQITTEGNAAFAQELETWLGNPLPHLREVLEGVRVRQPLRSYAEPIGVIKALNRVCTRATLPVYESSQDHEALTRLYEVTLAQMPKWQEDLLSLPVEY